MSPVSRVRSKGCSKVSKKSSKEYGGPLMKLSVRLMLPLSTTLIGTEVPRTSCKPKKSPKITAIIIPITIAELKYLFRRILLTMLNIVPSTVGSERKRIHH